jgi:alpha-beta hydrolase superfamily lysophospholipase
VIAREPLEMRMADGWTLRGEWLIPEQPRAVVVLSHAMMVNRRTLDRPRGRGLASTLAEAGAAVALCDLRGHGESGPRAADGADWSYDDLVADVAPMMAQAGARFPSLPRAAVGHSLFGHVTLAHLARGGAGVDRLVMLACNVHNPSWRATPIEWAKKLALIAVMAASARAIGYVPIRRLGRGSDDEARSYALDFLRNGIGPSWRARDGFDYFAALPSVTTPVLALVGAGDHFMAPRSDVAGLMRPVRSATVEIVGRASGLAIDPGHMQLVLDERARPAWQRVARFFLP